MLTIGDVASRAGLRASAIRYYEAQGLLPKPPRQSGRRVYSPAILDRLAMIELAKMAGFDLGEIRGLLSAVAGRQAAATWRTIVPAKQAEIDKRIERLDAMKQVLARLSACSCDTLDECGRRLRAATSS